MAKSTTSADALAAAYPNVARWVRDEEGRVELGADEMSRSFVRAVDAGGVVWEGEADYPTLDAAFAALDAGIAAWLGGAEPKRTGGMRHTPVDSSMLSAVGYDPATEELEAVFRSGAVWRYRRVPRAVYRQLLAADSKGSFMRTVVMGAYPEYRVRG